MHDAESRVVEVGPCLAQAVEELSYVCPLTGSAVESAWQVVEFSKMEPTNSFESGSDVFSLQKRLAGERACTRS